MYEVELKVEAEHAPVRRRLEELGARRVGTVTQRDTYYDHPARDFAATDEALRVRREEREGETVVKLTYKGPLVEAASKTRREHETVVADDEALADILDGVGFEPAAVVEKDRTFFEHDGYTVTLDSVAELGEYVEVEREATEVEPAREGAIDLLCELGLDPDAQILTSYLGLQLDASE